MSVKRGTGVYFFLKNAVLGLKLGLSSKSRFKIGDKVGISKYKRKVFDKGNTPNWTGKIFLVLIKSKKSNTNPITYRLKNLNNEEIQGSFNPITYRLKNLNNEEIQGSFNL